MWLLVLANVCHNGTRPSTAWCGDDHVMADKREILTAEDLDAMTPNERAAALDERIVTEVDKLPTVFVDRVMVTGRRIADELHIASAE